MRDWLDSIEARNRSQAKYDKENTVRLNLKFNIHTDKDIIQWLWQQSSKQGSIKRLIREDIAKEREALQLRGQETPAGKTKA